MNRNQGRKSAATPQINGPQNSGATRSNPIQNVGRNDTSSTQSKTGGAQGQQQHFTRGHLMNEHLGGAGTERNLFPITSQANSQHMSHIEAHAQRQQSQMPNQQVHYKVDVSHGSNATQQRTNMSDFGNIKNVGRGAYGAKKE